MAEIKSNRAWREECEALRAKMIRMQNAINWVSRASSINTKELGAVGLTAYFVGGIINETRALDDGARLTIPEVP